MNGLTLDDLVIAVDRDAPNVTRVSWTGRSNNREPGKALKPFFERLIQEVAQSSSSLEMHFEDLEHLNSSTIATLIQVINASQDARVALTLIYDASAKWQTLSFGALQRALKPFETSGESRLRFLASQNERSAH